MSLGKRDLELKFGSPEKLSARLMHLQESGRELAKVVQFTAPNDGWVPSRTDPPGSEGIGVKTASNLEDAPDDLSRVLAQLNGLHQRAIQIIDEYVDSKRKSSPNAMGSTEPPRYTPDNAISSRPGIRADKFSRQ